MRKIKKHTNYKYLFSCSCSWCFRQICSIMFCWRLICVFWSRISLAFWRWTSHLSIHLCCLCGTGFTHISLYSLIANFWSFKIMLCNMMQEYIILLIMVTSHWRAGCCIIPQCPLSTPKIHSTSFRALSCRLLKYFDLLKCMKSIKQTWTNSLSLASYARYRFVGIVSYIITVTGDEVGKDEYVYRRWVDDDYGWYISFINIFNLNKGW